jgi:hypothetical protein
MANTIKQTMMALPIYAADWQDAEMLLVPKILGPQERAEAAVSINYLQKRSLLLLTDDRILVINANAEPALVLSIPIESVKGASPSTWYGTGNVNCETTSGSFYFAMMSTGVYAKLAQSIETLATRKRQ